MRGRVTCHHLWLVLTCLACRVRRQFISSLEGSEFLNDNLVDFCLRRLQEELATQSPEDFQVRHRTRH